MNANHSPGLHHSICACESPGDKGAHGQAHPGPQQSYVPPPAPGLQTPQPGRNARAESIKTGDHIYYQGKKWTVQSCDQAEGTVTIAREGFRVFSPESVARLNLCRSMLPGERYAVERTNGNVQEGWQLLVVRSDGRLMMYKEDAQLVTVGVAEVFTG